jgi:hypothetical protein
MRYMLPLPHVVHAVPEALCHAVMSAVGPLLGGSPLSFEEAVARWVALRVIALATLYEGQPGINCVPITQLLGDRAEIAPTFALQTLDLTGVNATTFGYGEIGGDLPAALADLEKRFGVFRHREGRGAFDALLQLPSGQRLGIECKQSRPHTSSAFERLQHNDLAEIVETCKQQLGTCLLALKDIPVVVFTSRTRSRKLDLAMHPNVAVLCRPALRLFFGYGCADAVRGTWTACAPPGPDTHCAQSARACR